MITRGLVVAHFVAFTYNEYTENPAFPPGTHITCNIETFHDYDYVVLAEDMKQVSHVLIYTRLKLAR